MGNDPAARRTLENEVERAQDGDRDALELVVRAIQKDIYALALRFLAHPQDAEDATQEILVRIITKLGSFRGASAFRTWVYRVASNALLTMRKKRAERQARSFEEFGKDLVSGLSDGPLTVHSNVEEALVLEELKIGCTLALLLCLDRDQRIAYILGEIMELDHSEASEILEIGKAAYRKRLSRARATITAFMQAQCGLVNPANTCRCGRRANTAIALGRVAPDRLAFASSRKLAQRFPEVLGEIRRLEEARRAGALYRSHPSQEPSRDFVAFVRDLIVEVSVPVTRP